jgi:hypothetical protein
VIPGPAPSLLPALGVGVCGFSLNDSGAMPATKTRSA